MNSKPLNNIQMLRAIAALLVVMHHFRDVYLQMGGKHHAMEQIGYFGVAGVDIFFVISGFVIALTISRSQAGLYPALEYLKNRFLRIYLGYWPAFICMLVVAYFFVTPSLWEKFDFWRSLALLPIDPAQGKKVVLDVYWTLTFELYFYTLCLLAFFIPRKVFNTVLLIYFVAIAIKNIWMADSSFYKAQNFVTSFFIMEFIAGWFLYECRNHLQQRWLWPLLVIGLVLSVTAGIHFDARHLLIRACTFGMAGVFLVALCFWLEHRRVYQANRWFVSLGDASYAIYLFHVPLLVIFAYWGVWQKYSNHRLDMPEVAAVIFLGLLCSLCILYYENVEKPLYRAACQRLSFKKIIS